MTTRRDFLRNLTAAATAVGVAGAPKFAFGQTIHGKTLIKIFLRGGADGLHLFPKVNDPAYYEYRPDLGIEGPNQQDANASISLGSDLPRTLNPNLALLKEIWEDGKMMVAPATSFDGANGSHFDCQRWIGTGAQNNYIDGYMNRYLQEVSDSTHPIRGAVMGKDSLSTEIRGDIRVPVIRTATDFQLRNGLFCRGNDCEENRLTDMMRAVASHDVDLSAVENSIRETQLVMLDTIAEVRRAGSEYTATAGGMEYTNGGLGRGLKLCAQLLKAGIPLEVGTLDWNIGWDTHSEQISGGTDRFSNQGHRYHEEMTKGAHDMLTFYRDMGEAMDDIVVLVGSEFGRTKKQNGTQGTDHGRGGAWWAFGGPVRQGMAADVDTIDDSNFSENYVPMMTSYRDIAGEIMVRHMGMEENLISTVFPGHRFTDLRLLGGLA